MATQLFKKSCFDISSGGAAFITSKLESKFFQTGDVIENFEIEFEDKKIEAEAKVVQLKKLEKNKSKTIVYGEFLISLEFQKMKPEDKEFLKEMVFRYSEFQNVI